MHVTLYVQLHQLTFLQYDLPQWRRHEQEQEQDAEIGGPTNPMATPLLTNLYRFSMAHVYWKAAKYNQHDCESQFWIAKLLCLA